jgi:hypothetical protein
MHQKLGFTLSCRTPTLSLENYQCFQALTIVEWSFSAITIKVIQEDLSAKFLISPRGWARSLLRCNIKYRVCALLALYGAPASNWVRSLGSKPRTIPIDPKQK